MAHRRRKTNQSFAGRVGLLVVTCTTVLTLSFFGLVALVTGEALGIAERLPFYALGMAGIFVAAIIRLDQHRRDGRAVMAGAIAIALFGALLLSLGGEGLVYAVRNPGEAIASRQFPYLVSAGLMATGIGYWGMNHWRDVVGLRW